MNDPVYTAARLTRQIVMWSAFSILPPLFAAAGGPPPVTVTQPVSIQGVVETLNDTLNRPYARREADSLLSSSNQSSLTLNFNVPDGKRLIVETITFEAAHVTGAFVSVTFSVTDTENPQTPLTGYLTIQNRDTLGNAVFARGTHPIKLRVDSKPGSTSELKFTVSRSPFGLGSVPFEVTVFGYLADLPSVPIAP